MPVFRNDDTAQDENSQIKTTPQNVILWDYSHQSWNKIQNQGIDVQWITTKLDM